MARRAALSASPFITSPIQRGKLMPHCTSWMLLHHHPSHSLKQVPIPGRERGRRGGDGKGNFLSQKTVAASFMHRTSPEMRACPMSHESWKRLSFQEGRVLEIVEHGSSPFNPIDAGSGRRLQKEKGWCCGGRDSYHHHQSRKSNPNNTQLTILQI